MTRAELLDRATALANKLGLRLSTDLAGLSDEGLRRAVDELEGTQAAGPAGGVEGSVSQTADDQQSPNLPVAIGEPGQEVGLSAGPAEGAEAPAAAEPEPEIGEPELEDDPEPELESEERPTVALEPDLEGESGQSAAQPDREPASPRETPPFKIRVYTARELAALELPEPASPIVGPFLRKGMATLIGGPTGHGKSTWITHLLKAAVDGGEFLGERVDGGANVLVLDLEQHLESLQRLLVEAGLAEADAIDYAPIPEGLALDKRTDQLDELERVVAAKPYDVLAVDPFYKLHEADSSDELQARLLVALLRGWIKQHGFGLLTATHCRKLPAGRTVITLDDFFGSSLFTRDPEIVLGIQRHGDLTKLRVFKSREPGLDHGQVFELLFNRERGYWLKPTVDPEERSRKLEAAGQAAIAYIAEHPGESTNKVRKGVTGFSSDLVEEALGAQVKSGLHPAPLRGSRNSRRWYPPNHAALTSPETLLGEVTEGAANGQSGDDFTRPPDLPVRGREVSGEDVEAEIERLAERARHDQETT